MRCTPRGLKRAMVLSVAVLIMTGFQAAAQESGDIWTDPATGMEFAWVPGGCYEMGCDQDAGDCWEDESPRHEVCVDGFWLGRYEVTEGQWEMVMGENPSYVAQGSDYPVEMVSWEDAVAFIKNLEAMNDNTYVFRLPTEAEWEYACRSGGEEETYSGGEDVDAAAWYDGNSNGQKHRGGTRAPNGLGIYDMTGNVGEWVRDRYGADAYAAHSRDNPEYSSGGADRVVRGGCYGDYAWSTRCGVRDGRVADMRSPYHGLRIMRVK